MACAQRRETGIRNVFKAVPLDDALSITSAWMATFTGFDLGLAFLTSKALRRLLLPISAAEINELGRMPTN